MCRGGEYEAFFIETSGNEKRRRKMGCGKWSNRKGDKGYWEVAACAAETQIQIAIDTYSKTKCKWSP
jgi:hypothetical protein